MTRREDQINAVSGWWNVERNSIKWDKIYDGNNIHAKKYLRERQERVLKFLDEMDLPKGARVLELGYGAGQTALELASRGLEVHGLDISEGLTEVANARCRKMFPDGNFNLKTGNIEGNFEYEDNFFDAVVIIGALQYLYDPYACLKEAYRVLKPNGVVIIAQRNAYSLSNLTTARLFVRSLVHFIFREPYEVFPSYKSILTDTKLGSIFKRFKDSKALNSRFMLKDHDEWKFDVKKRNNTYFSLKKMLKRIGFTVEKKDGAYYCFSERPEKFNFNCKMDDYIKVRTSRRKIPGLFLFGRSVVLVSRKKQI